MPSRKEKPPLNFGDPTLDETEMLPRSVGWSLTEENYPQLRNFRFPGLDSPPDETTPLVDTRRRETKQRVKHVLKKKKPR